MFLPENTKVRYTAGADPLSGSAGVVCPRTAHTHRAYTVVFFPMQENPHLAHKAKSPLSRGVKMRVLTARLELM